MNRRRRDPNMATVFSLFLVALAALFVHSDCSVSHVVYRNGIVYTVDKNEQWHTEPEEAIVIENGIIKYVGSNNGTQEYIRKYNSDQTEFKVFDLHGNTMLPGIHDVHIHPLEAGSPVAGTCTLPSNTGPEMMRDRIRECAPNQIGTRWVLGFGYSIVDMLHHIRNGGRNPKEILDEVIPDRPAAMMEETSHSVWVNSKALAEAGIDENTPIRPGGIIMRDTNNMPNGILLENEVIEMFDIALKPSTTLDDYNYEGLFWSLKKLARSGITSICDARVYWKRNHHKAWDRACRENTLSVRAMLGLWAYPNNDDTSQLETLKSMYSSESPTCDNLLRKQQIKLYSDGILDSTTAAVLNPYLKNISLPGLSENIGMNYFNQSKMQMYIRELQNFDLGKGFDFHIHAIGDRGVRESLNAIEENFLSGTRHRLTHVEIVNPSDIPRFNELNVTADFQVAGKFALPDYIPEMELLVGTKAQSFIPVKSIIDSGGFATFSSDWDVSTYNPFIAIQHATERGAQAVDIKTAVEMYTINPAYVMRQEDKVGSLIVGKEADLIVVNKDILNVQVDGIDKTVVLRTLLKGKEVYRVTGGAYANTIEDVTSKYASGAKKEAVSSCLIMTIVYVVYSVSVA